MHFRTSTRLLGHGEEFHHPHGVGQRRQRFPLLFIHGADGGTGGISTRIGHAQGLQNRVGHAHQTEVPGNQIVDLAAFALHPLAGRFKVKVTGAQNDVREQLKELNHGLFPWHGHHGVKHVRGFGNAEVGRGFIDFDGGRI